MAVNQRYLPKRYHTHPELICLGEYFQGRFVELVLLYVHLDIVKVFRA